MSATATGAALGAVAGLGACLVLAHWPRGRRPDLSARLAPYLPRPAAGRPALAPAPVTVRGVLAPVVAEAARGVERVLGGAASVRRRMDAAGRGHGLAQFRAEQVLWGVAGLVAGSLLCVVLGVRRGWAPVPMALLVAVAAACGVLGRDWVLTWQARRRGERITAEFPAVAELLALAVAAGEGAPAAIERVARSGSGEVCGELRRVLGDVRAGAPLVVALEAMSARCDLPVLARFVDAVAVAVERGTPLADVLRAQAQDAREAGHRQLLEAGGRKEVLMLVPVVLLVLPVTVVFAVFPGLAVLRMGP